MKKKISNFDELTKESQQRRIQVRKFIAQSCELAKSLPPKKRVLYLMKFDSGFSNEEIAEICKCSVNTVDRKIKKIADEINQMRECVKD